jgi:hypothetical protein
MKPKPKKQQKAESYMRKSGKRTKDLPGLNDRGYDPKSVKRLRRLDPKDEEE